MSKVHYLAYGSNLHPKRLAQRIPAARVLGTVELLGYKLAFHKRSVDGSGKCMFYTGQGNDQIMYAVLYEFDSKYKKELDSLEGCGMGYVDTQIAVTLNGKQYTAYIYTAQAGSIVSGLMPYYWYKKLVIAGANYHQFPADYIASIQATVSQPDRDELRKQENDELVAELLD